VRSFFQKFFIIIGRCDGDETAGEKRFVVLHRLQAERTRKNPQTVKQATQAADEEIYRDIKGGGV
jgi:hypothetical protein